MGKFNIIQNSFTAGEVSDRSKGRRDLKEYSQAADEIQNMIVNPLGGISRRPGFRYVLDLVNADFDGKRIIPFVYSKNEAYAVAISGNENTFTGSQIRIFRTDGTEAEVTQTELAYPLGGTYDPANWKYSQSGDVLVLTYSDPETTSFNSNLVGYNEHRRIAPVFILRTDKDSFTAFTFTHPGFIASLLSHAKYSPAVNRPYLEANIDGNLLFYVSAVTIGASRTLYCVDSTGAPAPYFEYGHTFNSSGGIATLVGAFFRIEYNGTEGVCWGQAWPADLLVVSADINTGTDVVTYVGHGLSTKDIVVLAVTGGAGTTDPVITSFPLINNEVYGDFHVRALTANTLAFFTNAADAVANTNRINFTSAGDRGIRIQRRKVNSMAIVIEAPFEATMTIAANASDNWQESAWSAKRGFPRACTFHEECLFFGGTESEPDTIWKSQTGNIYNLMQRRLEQDSSAPTPRTATFSGFQFVLSGAVKETDPFTFTISSKQANVIQWLESQSVLLAGTMGTEYTISGFDKVISNTSLDIKKQTDHGSNNVEAVSAGVSIIYVSRDGRRLRDFKYNRDNGSFVSANLSIMADHMVFRGFGGASTDDLKGIQFSTLAYQSSRDIVWGLTTRGALVGLTLSKESEVVAWHYHETRSGDIIKSIAVIPNSDGSFDELWAVIQRTIDGASRRYLEKMGDDFDHDYLHNTSTTLDDTPFYVDSAVRVVQSSTSTTVTLPVNAFSGTTASNLKGATVDLLAGETVYRGLTVSSGGTVTTTSAVPINTIVIAGLRYTSRLITLDLEAGQDFGTSDGNRQRIDRVSARLYKSQGGSYGNSEQATLFDIEYSDTDVFTGIKRLDMDMSPDMENQVKIEHDDPTPFNILSLTYRGVSYD